MWLVAILPQVSASNGLFGFVSFAPMIDHDEIVVQVHHPVAVEIGLVPNSDIVKDLIKLKQSGEIPVSSSCETDMPGLFAAGDVTTVPEKQIVIAAGEGAKALLQAHRYLRSLPK